MGKEGNRREKKVIKKEGNKQRGREQKIDKGNEEG